MPRLLATAMSAVTIIGLGIVALSYRRQQLADASLTGLDAEAYNLTRNVSGDAMTIAATAYPWLLAVVILVLLLVMLVMISGR